MKNLLVLFIGAILIWSCDSDDDTTTAFSNDAIITATPMFRGMNPINIDLPYGEDAQQKLDLYLPTKWSTESAKTFVILHGGGWYTGDKSAMVNEVTFIRSVFPEYAVVNLNYRLATEDQLGYPMQTEDIAKAIAFLDENADAYRLSKEYAMIGISAGGHLAMLYSYKFDTTHEVKAVCSIVGPADFSDKTFQEYPLYQDGVNYLIGYNHYSENPAMYDEISPAKQVTAQSPKTLLLYGDADPIVANTQGPIMKQKLTEAGVYNELYQYPGAGHANWNTDQQNHVNLMQYAFFRKTF